MIRVIDLDRSMRSCANLLALRESCRLEFPDFALGYLRNDKNEFERELTLNRGKEEPYTHGSGHGHIAAVVDDARAGREHHGHYR